MTKPTWDETFIELMEVIAKRSDDPRTKVGCVVVDQSNALVSIGYNGAPRGVPNAWVSDVPREKKYPFVEHADRNAIYNACRLGLSLKGCTMYLPWAPCEDCARAIIQVGITHLVLLTDQIQPEWVDSCENGFHMMNKAGVFIRLMNRLYRLDILRVTTPANRAKDNPFVVVRMNDQDSHYYVAMDFFDVQNYGSIVSYHPTMEVAETAAKVNDP